MEIPLGLYDADRINSLIDLDINKLFLEKPCSDVSKVLLHDPSEWLQSVMGLRGSHRIA